MTMILPIVVAVLSLLLYLLPSNAFVGSYCNSDGSTSVAAPGDFRYNSIAFGNKFQPTCTCTNNSLQCINECETCFRGVCGVLETSQDERPDTSVVSNYSLCMTYTNGRAPVGGTTCFKYDQAAENTTYPDGSKICDMTYNGESCTWCKMYESGCIRANCTNILQDAKVDTCWTAYQGIEQQFRLVALVNNITAIQQTRLGYCGYSGDDINSIQIRNDDDSLQFNSNETNDESSQGNTSRGDDENQANDNSDPNLESSDERLGLLSWLTVTWLIFCVRLLSQ